MTLMFTIALNGYDQEYADCIETQAAYCKRLNYRYWLVDSTPWKLTARQTAWLKVVILRYMLKNGCEDVAFIDADCEIRRHAPPFATAFVPGKSLMIAPGKSGRLNSGVIFSRADASAVSFLSTILQHADEPVPKEFATKYENGHFIYYGQESDVIGTLDHRLWNNNSAFDEGSYIQHYSDGVMRRFRKRQRQASVPAAAQLEQAADISGMSISQFVEVAEEWLSRHLGPRPRRRARSVLWTAIARRVKLAGRALTRGDLVVRSGAIKTGPSGGGSPKRAKSERQSRTRAFTVHAIKPRAVSTPLLPLYDGKSLALYHWTRPGIRNFGDDISPLIVKRMLGPRGAEIEVVEAAKGQRKLLAVGSILQYAGPGDVVWGAGVNGKTWIRNLGADRPLDVRAVRGPLTRRALMEAGLDCPEIYGDPGHLFADLFSAEIAATEAGESSSVIYIPNISDEMHRPRANLPSGVRYVSPTETPFRIAKLISGANLVISGSLHGMVFADAMKVPCRPLTSWFEPPFKYFDYFLGTGRDEVRFYATIEEALAGTDLPPAYVDTARLAAAFPADIVSDIQ